MNEGTEHRATLRSDSAAYAWLLHSLIEDKDTSYKGRKVRVFSAERTPTGRVTFRYREVAATEWAAVVLDKEHGVHTGPDRHNAIDAATEGAREDVYNGDEEPGVVEVEIYADPEWCEKAPQFCDEHDHDEYPRWLMNQAGVVISVEIYFADPGVEDSEVDWREVTA